jgi:hypothetical protein
MTKIKFNSWSWQYNEGYIPFFLSTLSPQSVVGSPQKEAESNSFWYVAQVVSAAESWADRLRATDYGLRTTDYGLRTPTQNPLIAFALLSSNGGLG